MLGSQSLSCLSLPARPALSGCPALSPAGSLPQRPAAVHQRVYASGVATTDEEGAEELLRRASGTGFGASSSGQARKEPFDGRAFRRSLGKTGRYQRQPKNDAASLALMEEHGVGYSSSGLVAQMRANYNVWQHKDVHIRLAQAYGYCWGVERAVQMAYEARKQYPERKVHITNEIIHNPAVNQRLKEMDLEIIEDKGEGKDFSHVNADDVVILPAFGASVQEMQLLNNRGVQIVDTTCPWVSKVWMAIDKQARKQHTSIIHGKYSHEETIATASFATVYLIVRDLEEAEYVAHYILEGGSKDEFLARFTNAVSPGFDPDSDLLRVGLANQTTMLRNETMQIGKLLERTMMEKYGPAVLADHYMVMDTICDATQERQDAVTAMVSEGNWPDMMVVVGGFNSSNTSHLQEIPEKAGVPSFWVNSAACIDVDRNRITHKTAHGDMMETTSWLPEGPINIGVTSGASTPDRAVEDVLDRVFRIKDPNFIGVQPDMDLLAKAAELKQDMHHEEAGII